ncbi:MAG: sigma-70 family RNA polymerase sigma factor [Planctomycetota bacterium]
MSQSASTSVTLLARVQDPADDVAWEHFVDLYGPLLYRWSRRQGLGHAAAEDLMQDVFATLLVELPKFRYQQGGSFRAWLKTITSNRVKNFLRNESKRPDVGKDAVIDRQASPEQAVEFFDDAEFASYVAKRSLKLIQGEFAERDWRSFWMQMIEQRTAVDVSQELGINLNQVYLAKSRIMRRLRAFSEGLLD